MKHVRFYELMETKLNAVLKSVKLDGDLTKSTLSTVRNAIYEELNAVINKNKTRLTDEAVWWLTDMYFKSIKINDSMFMSDQVVIHERTMGDLSFNDVILLSDLYNDHSFGTELLAERKRRCTS